MHLVSMKTRRTLEKKDPAVAGYAERFLARITLDNGSIHVTENLHNINGTGGSDMV